VIALLRTHLFDFERLEARRNALFLLLAAAIVSPDIPTPSPLPAIRLEQIALAFLLPSLVLYYRRHPELRRPLFVDWAFLAMGVAVAASLVFAPIIVKQSHYSLRDPFELARLAEYWLMFRLARTIIPDAEAVRGVVRVALVAAVAVGLLSAVQYLGPAGFNNSVTDIWASSHNLDGVIRRSRAVGSIGNANYYGIFSGLLLAMSLALVLLRYPLRGRERQLVLAAILMSTAGVVMSQSRTAGFAVLGALFLGTCFTFLVRRRDAAYGAAIGLFAVSLALSVAFVEIFPPNFGSFHDRFSVTALTDDPSVTIRITKWRSLVSGFFQDKPERCVGNRVAPRATSGHQPAANRGGASGAAAARDATRKQDIQAIAHAIQQYSCDTGKWPVGELAASVVPKYLDSIPGDPQTGEPYRMFLDRGGYIVGANLENAADPEGPVYALGTMPNIIVNPSFESATAPASRWETAKEVDGRPTTLLSLANTSLFGKYALNAEIGSTGSLYQFTVFDFPMGVDYTVSAWLRANAAEDQKVSLYMIGTLSDGSTVDPLKSLEVVLPGDGRWVPVTLTFKTPTGNRLSVLQTSFRAPEQTSHVTVDGVTLTQGPFPPAFPYVEDIDPTKLRPSDLAGFSDSPIIGIGPQKDRQVGAFDNEYALMLDRYGTLGTLAYLTLMVAAFLVPARAFQTKHPELMALGLALATYTIAQAAFNVAAGSYYSFQIMAIYWLLIGLISRGLTEARTATAAATVPETIKARAGAILPEGVRAARTAEPGRVAADTTRTARGD
jgi:hypothetical protein